MPDLFLFVTAAAIPLSNALVPKSLRGPPAPRKPRKPRAQEVAPRQPYKPRDKPRAQEVAPRLSGQPLFVEADADMRLRRPPTLDSPGGTVSLEAARRVYCEEFGLEASVLLQQGSDNALRKRFDTAYHTLPALAPQRKGSVVSDATCAQSTSGSLRS